MGREDQLTKNNCYMKMFILLIYSIETIFLFVKTFNNCLFLPSHYVFRTLLIKKMSYNIPFTK